MIPIQSVRSDRESELLKDGWSKQSILAEPRLSEIVENYQFLGYEVHVEEFRGQSGNDCTTCFDAGKEMGQIYGTVYVRKRIGVTKDDELF